MALLYLQSTQTLTFLMHSCSSNGSGHSNFRGWCWSALPGRHTIYAMHDGHWI